MYKNAYSQYILIRLSGFNCLLHQILYIFQFTCLKLIVNYCINYGALYVNDLYIHWATIYILSWTTKRHQKILSRLLHSKLKKIQALFKDLHRNLRTFQGKMEFRTFQGLPLKFKDFSRLCEPCYTLTCTKHYNSHALSCMTSFVLTPVP